MLFDPSIFQALLGIYCFWALVTVVANAFSRRRVTADANWLPLALAAGSAILGGISKHKQNKANKQALEQENKNAQADYAARQKIVGDLAARGIDIYGPQTTRGMSSSTGQTGGRSRTVSEEEFRRNPFITEQYKPMETQLRSLIEGRLGKATTVSEAEKAAQLRNINAASAGALQSIRNMAGGRGLSAAQIGAAGAPVQVGRAGQIASYMATLPDIERQRRAEDLGLASGAIGAFGKGEEGTSRGVSTTDQSGWSNQMGSSSQTGGPDIGALLALNAPAGRVSTNTGYNPLLSGGADALGALSGYFANKPARTQQPVQPLPWGKPNPSLNQAPRF